MAVSQELLAKLADALSQPSKAYRTAQAGLNIPLQALQGYRAGAGIGDEFRQRKLKQQTLSDALGGQDVESGLLNMTGEQGAIQSPTLGIYASLEKSKHEHMPKAEDFLTPDQARAANVPEKLIQSFGGGAIPRQVALGVVNSGIGQQRANASTSMASSRDKSVQNSILGTALRYSQAGQAQTAAKDSFGRLANINRAQQIIDQINSQSGQATVRQRTELASAVGRSINPTGVLTNEALSLYIPNSLKQKVGNFTEYLTNQSNPVDFSGFLPELGGLLDREKEVNRGLIEGASQFGQPALTQLKGVNPTLANQVQAADQNPLLTNPVADPEAESAIQRVMASNQPEAKKQAAIRVIRQRASSGR